MVVPGAGVTRTSIDLQGDCGLTGAELTGGVDVTAALAHADQLCAQYGVNKVTLPSKAALLISTAKGGNPIHQPVHGRDWVSPNPEGCELVVDVGARPFDTELYAWIHNPNEALLAFSINGQATKQMLGHAQRDGGGNLQGFCMGGVKINGDHAQYHGKVRNMRSISATGTGSVFGVQSLANLGGEFWVIFDTDDGSTGSEAIVNQGKTGVVGQQNDPWIIRSLRSTRMWRGMGCYSGGYGEVYDAIVANCHGPADAKAPGGQISGNAFNLEAGTGGTNSVILHNPQSTDADRFLVINGNSATDIVHAVQVIGGSSTRDGTGILITGDAPGSVDVSDWTCDSPTAGVLSIDPGALDRVSFQRSHYKLVGAAKLNVKGGSAPSGLTPGTPALSISAVSPGAWTRGTARTVRVTGTGFAVGVRVAIGGKNITLSQLARRSATSLSFKASIGRRVSVGPRTLTVVAPNGARAQTTVHVA